MSIVKRKNREGAVPPKKKERRCVTWTTEEDDLLREETSIHGTEKWRIIAAKFKGKTARQCRRRYINLNSDLKKGSWSPEEDLLLCEAHKEFGNKWTEIAKVVTGRTDNAVKNRFNTLCKKRARLKALDKENNATYINTNNKRPISDSNVLHSQGSLHAASSHKKRRFAHAPDLLENDKTGSFEVLAQNGDEIDTQHSQHQVTIQEALIGGDVKVEGFSKKDDPKIFALKQQAELLSSLAVKINTENTELSMENACKAIEDFLCDSKDGEVPNCSISDADLLLDQLRDLVDMKCCNTENQPSKRQPGLYDSPRSCEDFLCDDSKDGEVPNCSISAVDLLLDQLKDLVDMKCCDTENQPSQRQPGLYDSPSSSEDFLCDSKDGEAPNCSISEVDLHLDQLKDLVDMKCSYTENQPSQRQPDLYDSPSSSEYSIAATILPTNTSEQTEQTQSEMCGLSEDAGTRLENIGSRDEIVLLCAEVNNDGDVSALSDTVFSSPQVTPSFSSLRVTQSYSSLRAIVPSPEFSDSERHYLIERIELESRTTSRINLSHPPPCRRALVHSL